MKYIMLFFIICNLSLALECEEGAYSVNSDDIEFCAYPEEVDEINRQMNEEGLTKEELYDYMDLRKPEPEPEPEINSSETLEGE